MGYDAEDAEAQYWEARGLGYTDEQILAMDEWPVRPAPETPAMKARREWRERYFSPTARATLEALDMHDRMKGQTPMYESAYRYTEPKPPVRTMRTKEIAAQLRAQIAEAQKALALLDKIPGEPAEKMTTFGVSFDGSEQVYTYVAMRINGKWRVTGRHFSGGKYDWEEIFSRFDQIRAKVLFMSTPVEFRSEDIER